MNLLGQELARERIRDRGAAAAKRREAGQARALARARRSGSAKGGRLRRPQAR